MYGRLWFSRQLKYAVLMLAVAGGRCASAAEEGLAEELKRLPYALLFESCRDGNWDLHRMRADGSERVNLTDTPDVQEMYPHVSADGRRVVFLVDAGKNEATTRDVYCLNIDGSSRRLVVRGGRDPCWTADGQAIVYARSEFEQFTLKDFATRGVFLYDLVTGRERQHANANLYHVFALCATSDGNWYLATVHGGMGYSHAILAVGAAGQRFFDLQIPGCRPDMSPDGKRIAWAASDYSLAVGDFDVAEGKPRVTNRREIITSEKPWKVQHVDWSPDGRYVAFSRGPYREGLGLAGSPALVGARAPHWDICVGDPAATNRWVAITSDGNSNKEPDWLPSGSEAR